MKSVVRQWFVGGGEKNATSSSGGGSVLDKDEDEEIRMAAFMRLWRESLLGAEAPKAFHALPGGPSFLAAPKKEAKKVACASLAAPMICGKNLIQSSRLHSIKSISLASPFIPQFKINYLIHLSEPPPSIGQLLSRQSRAGFRLRLVGKKK